MKNFLKWRSNLNESMSGTGETRRPPKDVKFYSLLKSMINVVPYNGVNENDGDDGGFFVAANGYMLTSDLASKRLTIQDGKGHILFDIEEGDPVDVMLSSFVNCLSFEVYCLEHGIS